ncbi:MAG: NUDIX domain-containing protein [Trueperaceae bacterium]|nr:MAG: NUDIX domain-containing protein [Trueperaceae bacterium]
MDLKAQADRYPVVTVGALVVSPKRRVLLVHTHKWRGRWGVPGGKIEYGESVRCALLREFREETGLRLTEIRRGPVQEAIESPEFFKKRHFILLNFIATCESEQVELNDEAQQFAWADPEEALTLDLNTPTRALIEFYLRHGFSTEVLT